MAKKKEKHDSEYWVDLVDKDYSKSRDFRQQKVEKQWMINHAWYKGLQNLKYDTQLKRLVWDENDPFRFFVNQVYVVVRAIRSALTRSQPSWEVDPEPYGSLLPDETRVLSAYLDYLYEKLNIKHLTKEFVMYGLLYSHGIIEYGWDDEADGGEGSPWVDVLDPFDVYIDPAATEIQNARFVIKCIRKPISEVQKNEKYKNTEDLKSDGQMSGSTYKDMLQEKTYGGSETTSDHDTVLLKEAWIKDGDIIRVVTTADKRLLRNEETEYAEYPFIMFFPDINPNEIYSEGWVKNLVPLNRALNHNERNILEYNVLFSKGKYVTDKTSGVKMVTNENGQIIRVNPGQRFEQMDVKPMSSTPFNQIQNIMQYIQDVGASHEAFMGNTPTGVTAAIAIEQLVANNYNNLSDTLDNLEITLSTLGEKLLGLAYEYGTTSKLFRMKAAEANAFTTAGVIGGGLKAPSQNIVPIPERTKVRVRVVSGIAHTKEARRDFLLALFKMGIVDKRTVLEEAGLNADEILARIQQEKMGLPISREAVNAPPPMPPQAPPPEQMQMGPAPMGPEAPMAL